MSALNITTLFFDAGGTLLHPKDPVGETYAEVAQAFGVDLDPIATEKGFRNAFKQLRNRPLGTIPRDGDDRGWWRTVVRQAVGGQVLPEDFVFEDYFEMLYQTYEDPNRWVLYPEVEEILALLHGRGYQMAVISNWDSRLRRILDGHFLTAFFGGIFISGELGLAKPTLALYERAQKSMGCGVHQAVMIGDDLENDSQAPQKLGWQSILIERPNFDLHKLLDYLMLRSN